MCPVCGHSELDIEECDCADHVHACCLTCFWTFNLILPNLIPYGRVAQSVRASC